MFLTKVSSTNSLMTLLTLLSLLTLLPFGNVVFAEDSADKPPSSASEKSKAHLMNNIDIFGKTDLQAIYILMPSGIDDEDIKGSLITRDFSRDPFFMQNVDREEFEMKVTLHEINGDEDEKKKEAQR